MDVRDSDDWQNIGREAALIVSLIGSGITALGKADYSLRLGDYYMAFFGLSIGIERMCKLIIVADEAIKNHGKMPSQKIVRKFGHKISDLVDYSYEIYTRNNLNCKYKKPEDDISTIIIKFLDDFADAKKGRYANFAALEDPSFFELEPITEWRLKVGEEILKRHYYGKTLQNTSERNASTIHSMMNPFSTVMHLSEDRQKIDDVYSTSILTAQNQIIQKYGRFYALVTVRWLSEVLSELSEVACYQHRIIGFCGLEELFYTFVVEDKYLREIKRWPLNRR